MTVGSTPAAPNLDSPLSVWLSYALLVAGLGAGVASAYIVISTYSPLPHWDEWALFDHLATGKGWSPAWLWAQHNEHRILIPKIFFLIDVQLFHGRQIFLLASIFAIQLLQAALLSFSLWTLGGLRGSAWRAGTGLIAYCILCPTQQENLIWGFQLQFVVPAAMATLAVLSLLLCCRESAARTRALFFLLAIAAATLATWSLANGMLLWAVLLLAAVLLRMRRPALPALAVCAVTNVGLYLYRYHRPSPQSGALHITSIAEILRFILVYFGSTFIRHSAGSMALAVGAVGICAALWILVFAIRHCRTIPQSTDVPHSGRESRLLLELALLMLFCLATATITAFGRLHLGLEQATASRYQTFALLFWCCLGLVLLVPASKNAAQLKMLCACLLALMLGFGTQVRLPLIDAQWRQLRLKMISLALLTGVRDPAVLADAYPDPRVVLRAAEYMRNNRLSIFGGDLYAQLGQPLNAVYGLRPGSGCAGYVTSSQVLPAEQGQGLRLTGFAWDRELHRPARAIVAVVDGRISGVGASVSIPLNSAAATPSSDATRFGWLTFVGDMHPATMSELYAVVGKNAAEVCPFAQTSPVSVLHSPIPRAHHGSVRMRGDRRHDHPAESACRESPAVGRRSLG